MSTKLETPVLLSPNLVENVWGGGWINDIKGLPPAGKPIGESWEFSVHPDHPGEAIINGKDIAIAAIIDPQAAGLLVKLIDARDNLSLQVHPDDAYARRHEKSSGKSESWLILGTGAAADDGFIYLGFSAAARRKFKTAEEFASAFERACRAADQSVLSFLNKIKVRAGEAFHVPPGTVHAVGKGVRFFEIQQSSGLTYRLWDWNRAGRELHFQKALDVINFSADAVRADPGRIADPLGNYEARVFAVTSNTSLPAAETFSVLTVLEGKVDLEPGPKQIKAGHSVLIPADLDVRLTSAGNARAVRSRPTGPRLSSE